MRFKTSSGTEYILNNVEMQIQPTGESCPSVGPQGIPVTVIYTGMLARIGVPLRDISGGDFDNTDEFYSVEFMSMPAIGHSFIYNHQLWAGCASTPISEIRKDEHHESL